MLKNPKKLIYFYYRKFERSFLILILRKKIKIKNVLIQDAVKEIFYPFLKAYLNLLNLFFFIFKIIIR